MSETRSSEAHHGADREPRKVRRDRILHSGLQLFRQRFEFAVRQPVCSERPMVVSRGISYRTRPALSVPRTPWSCSISEMHRIMDKELQNGAPALR